MVARTEWRCHRIVDLGRISEHCASAQPRFRPAANELLLRPARSGEHGRRVRHRRSRTSRNYLRGNRRRVLTWRHKMEEIEIKCQPEWSEPPPAIYRAISTADRL